MDAGTNGTLYFDDFESRRFSYIGTLPDPGVDDPTATNAPGWMASTYAYSATIPHAVTSVAIENGGTNTYTYDSNGNMTCRTENGVTYTHTYNAENRASSIAKRSGDCATGTIIESWSFAYDGDGTRVMTAHFTGTQGTPDSTTAYYMGGAYEVKDGAAKKYYSIAGMMVAVNDGAGLQYLLTDHLGSTVVVTNSSGTLTSQQRYLPFGEARTIPNSPILGTDFGYTGQRMLDDGMGGIMDYKARFYSPALMRFLQPDSIIPDQSNPQSWNRFSYTFNNPIRYNDPDGHSPACFAGPVALATCAIIVGTVVVIVVKLWNAYHIGVEDERDRLFVTAVPPPSPTFEYLGPPVYKPGPTRTPTYGPLPPTPLPNCEYLVQANCNTTTPTSTPTPASTSTPTNTPTDTSTNTSTSTSTNTQTQTGSSGGGLRRDRRNRILME